MKTSLYPVERPTQVKHTSPSHQTRIPEFKSKDNNITDLCLYLFPYPTPKKPVEVQKIHFPENEATVGVGAALMDPFPFVTEIKEQKDINIQPKISIKPINKQKQQINEIIRKLPPQKEIKKQTNPPNRRQIQQKINLFPQSQENSTISKLTKFSSIFQQITNSKSLPTQKINEEYLKLAKIRENTKIKITSDDFITTYIYLRTQYDEKIA